MMKKLHTPNSVRPIDRSRWLFGALSVVAVLYALIGAWLVTAGPSDPVAHTAAFLDHLVSPSMLATYAVALAFIAFGAWNLRAPPPSVRSPEVEAIRRRTAVQFVVVLVLVAASLSGIGWLYVRDLEITSQAERARQQEVVARLKAQQIGKWLFERSIDSELLAASLVRLPLDRLPGDADVAQVVGLLFAETLAADPERLAVTLFAADGSVLVHAGEGGTPEQPVVRAVGALALAPASAPRIVDIYDSATHPRMAFLAPVAARGSSASAADVIAIIVDPFRGVLDQIRAWPTPSASSEVMVVHRDGDDVVFITPPRLSPTPPPNSWRQPLTNSTLPAAEAILRGDGVRPGRDYRGAEVLTASQRVNGVPWTVVAKTDSAEYAAPLQRRERTLVLLIGAAVLLAAVMLVVLWRGEQAAIASQQQRAESDRAALSRHFAQLTRLARDIILMIDPDGRIIDANEAAIAAYGYTEAELCRLTVAELRTPEEYGRYERDWRAGETTDGVLVETVHRRKDGTTFPVEVSGRTIEVDGKRYRQAFMRDISVRKRLERQVARMSQVRSALQAATSVLLRARGEDEIYQQICEVVVRLGGYRMANVGLPVDDAEKTVRFAAVAGVDDGYLAQAAISWGEGPRGQGPTGTALRTGRTQVNQDFATNPRTALWRDEALKRGFHSSMALTLQADGKTFAAFTLYAAEPDAFDPDEVALLEALAADIAFAAIRLRPPTQATRDA